MDDKLIQKLSEILKKSTPEVKKVVMEGDLDKDVLTLSEKYGLNVFESVAIKNTILLTLLEIIKVEEVKDELKKNLNIGEEKLSQLLKDIDTGIFEKARIRLFGKEHEEGEEVRNITLSKDNDKDRLRDQIMARTDRDSAIINSPIENTIQSKQEDSSPVVPGSRSDLLEKLNVLDAIPNTDEVEERLEIIKNQISNIEATTSDETKVEEPVEVEPTEVTVKEKKSYPTHYSVDPYREIPS